MSGCDVGVLCLRGACDVIDQKKSLALGFFAEMIIMSGRPRGIFDSWHRELVLAPNLRPDLLLLFSFHHILIRLVVSRLLPCEGC